MLCSRFLQRVQISVIAEALGGDRRALRQVAQLMMASAGAVVVACTASLPVDSGKDGRDGQRQGREQVKQGRVGASVTFTSARSPTVPDSPTRAVRHRPALRCRGR